MDTMAPDGLVRLWPRRIDLENTDRLKGFEATMVVEELAELERAVTTRLRPRRRLRRRPGRGATVNERILFLTGHLAEPRLRGVLAAWARPRSRGRSAISASRWRP